MKFQMKTPDVIDSSMIAPCGMNCGICSALLRERNICSGCNGDEAQKPDSCVACQIRNCPELEGNELAFCFVCAKYPCPRLRRLDKRYRTRYGMSMIENLGNIRELGLDEFAARERVRWSCPGCGGVICAHKPECVHCGRARALTN